MAARIAHLAQTLTFILILTCLATTQAVGSIGPIFTALVRIPGHVLPALPHAKLMKRTSGAGAHKLTLTVVLKHDDQVGFESYLHSLYEPQSPNFHRFLTQRQIADRFGPSKEDYGSLLTYLRRYGFKLVEGSANRLTLTVRGTRVQAERAFAVHIDDYRLGDRTFYANEDDPALPADVAAHVASIVGLSNLARAHRTYLLSLLPNCAKDDAPQFGGNLPKAQYYCDHGNVNGYNGPKGTVDPPPPNWLNFSGAGQTIALIEFDTFSKSDVSNYLALTAAPATIINQIRQIDVNGGATLGANEAEVLVDVDTIVNNAPGASVVVYDAPFTGAGSFQSLFNAAISGGATIISNSWAYCEDQTTLSDVQSLDTIFQNAEMGGVTIFNGAGDSGSTCLDGSLSTVAVPADSPNATAVGGSSMTPGPGSELRG